MWTAGVPAHSYGFQNGRRRCTNTDRRTKIWCGRYCVTASLKRAARRFDGLNAGGGKAATTSESSSPMQMRSFAPGFTRIG